MRGNKRKEEQMLPQEEGCVVVVLTHTYTHTQSLNSNSIWMQRWETKVEDISAK